MKKTILIQLIILLAFSTASIAQQTTFPKSSKTPLNPSSAAIVTTDVTCTTFFAFKQEGTTANRTIEVVKQGHRDSDGDCVFTVKLFVPSHLEQHLGNEIKWQIDGQTVTSNSRQIEVPVPDSTTIVTVNYTIGNQQASASRTFLVD